MSLFLMTILLIIAVNKSVSLEQIYVCEASETKYLGVYLKNKEKNVDDTEIYSNENELSFFRHKSFWYLGDLRYELYKFDFKSGNIFIHI